MNRRKNQVGAHHQFAEGGLGVFGIEEDADSGLSER